MAGVGSKRFVLKPFKPSPSMDQHQAVETFGKLQQAILKIYAREQSQLSYEELYRFAYLMVLHKHGEVLYSGVSETVRRHLGKLADGVRAAPDEALLGRLEEVWAQHTREMRMVRDILMYMDRTYVPMSRKLLSYDHGTVLFREVVAREPAIRARAQRLLLSAVADARVGQALDIPLLRGVLGMLLELGVASSAVYMEDFEVPLLEETSTAYKGETAAFLAAHSCPEYLAHAESRLTGEMARAREFMHASTIPKLESALHRCLVGDHAAALLEKEGSGLVPMLDRDATQGNADDLARMYHLFSLHRLPIPWKDRSGATRMVPPIAALRDAMKAHIAETAKEIVSDPENIKDPSVYVRKLMELRAKYVRLVEQAFTNDADFTRAVKEAFELALNRQGDRKPPENLSLFLDEHFRSGFRGLSDSAVDEVLTSAVALFRFLSNKDEFEEWYKIHLHKRLLGNKVGSDDAERLMISKLKTECGFAYTTKLEGMFTDLKVSADFMEKYKRDVGVGLGFPSQVPASAGRGGRQVDLDVTVLTKNNWPASTLPPCNLPAEVRSVSEAFRAYYLQAHSGRRLTWHTEKGTAELSFVPATGRRHELTVSTFQMALLVMFNSSEQVTFQEMVESTGVPADELGRHVLSLLNPKVPILKRVPGAEVAGKAGLGQSDLEQKDILMVNSEFTSKMVRIKVPLISHKSASAALGGAGGAQAGATAEDGDFTAQVETQRKSMLDAAIVRIMKARKTLDHANLVAEVTRQLSSRFLPAPADVKKRVEDLIEREFLERDAADKKLYSYCA